MASLDFSTEEWRPVSGCEGYVVSNYGRVRSLDRLVKAPSHIGGQRLANGRILQQTI